MPEVIPTEEVRADQIEKGQAIWDPNYEDWLVVGSIERDDVDVFFARPGGGEAIFAQAGLVLRRAAPASHPAVTNDDMERMVASLVEADGHPPWALIPPEVKGWLLGAYAQRAYDELASQENTGGEG